jgi:Spy/CpxP family protein refolding chaperone
MTILPGTRRADPELEECMKMTLTVLTGVLLAAAPVYGQQAHNHEQAAGEKCEMHAAKHAEGGSHDEHASDPLHRNMPKMVLQHASGLKLTPAQVTQLEQLQAAHKAECEERMVQVKAAEAAAAAAVAAATPDARTFELKLREAANLKVDCKLDMLKTGQAAQAVLTAEQRAHLTHMGHAGH